MTNLTFVAGLALRFGGVWQSMVVCGAVLQGMACSVVRQRFGKPSLGGACYGELRYGAKR